VLAHPRLISSSIGALTRVLLAFPRYVFQHADHYQIHADLLRKLPSTTQLVLLVHVSMRPNLESLLHRLELSGRTTLIEVPESINFSVWMTDMGVITQEQGVGPEVLAEPVAVTRVNDAMLAGLISTHIDISRSPQPLYFEGGNILVGDDFWLLGADNVDHSLHLGLIEPHSQEDLAAQARHSFCAALETSRQLHLIQSTLEVPRQFERPFIHQGEVWTEIFYAGNRYRTVQPIFHIDMFLTLAGRDADQRNIILVGDSALAAEILGEPLLEQAMASHYDDIAGTLSRAGFSVIRTPLPLVHQDDPETRTRKWYFASSNNALVQIVGAQKQVWLPTYGHGRFAHLSATDAVNRRIWEDLNFMVTHLTDCHPLAYNLGGVRCMTQYLARRATASAFMDPSSSGMES